MPSSKKRKSPNPKSSTNLSSELSGAVFDSPDLVAVIATCLAKTWDRCDGFDVSDVVTSYVEDDSRRNGGAEWPIPNHNLNMPSIQDESSQENSSGWEYRAKLLGNRYVLRKSRRQGARDVLLTLYRLRRVTKHCTGPADDALEFVASDAHARLVGWVMAFKTYAYDVESYVTGLGNPDDDVGPFPVWSQVEDPIDELIFNHTLRGGTTRDDEFLHADVDLSCCYIGVSLTEEIDRSDIHGLSIMMRDTAEGRMIPNTPKSLFAALTASCELCRERASARCGRTRPYKSCALCNSSFSMDGSMNFGEFQGDYSEFCLKHPSVCNGVIFTPWTSTLRPEHKVDEGHGIAVARELFRGELPYVSANHTVDLAIVVHTRDISMSHPFDAKNWNGGWELDTYYGMIVAANPEKPRSSAEISCRNVLMALNATEKGRRCIIRAVKWVHSADMSGLADDATWSSWPEEGNEASGIPSRESAKATIVSETLRGLQIMCTIVLHKSEWLTEQLKRQMRDNFAKSLECPHSLAELIRVSNEELDRLDSAGNGLIESRKLRRMNKYEKWRQMALKECIDALCADSIIGEVWTKATTGFDPKLGFKPVEGFICDASHPNPNAEIFESWAFGKTLLRPVREKNVNALMILRKRPPKNFSPMVGSAIAYFRLLHRIVGCSGVQLPFSIEKVVSETPVHPVRWLGAHGVDKILEIVRVMVPRKFETKRERPMERGICFVGKFMSRALNQNTTMAIQATHVYQRVPYVVNVHEQKAQPSPWALCHLYNDTRVLGVTLSVSVSDPCARAHPYRGGLISPENELRFSCSLVLADLPEGVGTVDEAFKPKSTQGVTKREWLEMAQRFCDRVNLANNVPTRRLETLSALLRAKWARRPADRKWCLGFLSDPYHHFEEYGVGGVVLRGELRRSDKLLQPPRVDNCRALGFQECRCCSSRCKWTFCSQNKDKAFGKDRSGAVVQPPIFDFYDSE
jgi:hypothetical protein